MEMDGNDMPPLEPRQPKEPKKQKKPKLPQRPPHPLRRSLIAQLPFPLNRLVQERVQAAAGSLVRDCLLFANGDLAVKVTAKQLRSREIKRSIEQALLRRAKIASAQGVSETSERSRLTNRQATNAMNDHMDADAYYPMAGPRRGLAIVGEIGVTKPGLKVGDKVLQLLGWISQFIFHKIRDMEVQAMLVEGTVFVSANAKAALAGLRDEALREGLLRAAEMVAGEDGDHKEERRLNLGSLAVALAEGEAEEDELTEQQKRGADVLAEIEAAHHMQYELRKDLRELVGVIQQQVRKRTELVGPLKPEAAAGCIGKAEYTGKIILVDSPGTGWHAEQVLAYTLVLSGQRKASISGTKRPCTLCFHTLSMVSQYGWQLDFDTCPGFFWKNPIKGFWRIAQKLGVEGEEGVENVLDIARDYLTEDEVRQYMTALNGEGASTIDTRERPKKSKLAHRGKLTQDSSQVSFRVQLDSPSDQQTAASGEAYTPPPPGQYGTPLSDPEVPAETKRLAGYRKEQEVLRRQIALRKDIEGATNEGNSEKEERKKGDEARRGKGKGKVRRWAKKRNKNDE